MNQFLSHNSSVPNSSDSKPLGQLLNEAGLISAQQIELALREQIIHNQGKRIGEILASKGWIAQETADFFVEQWHNLVKSPEKKPLVYYFRRAGLLNEQQIEQVMQERNKSSTKIRFHQIAVRQGLIAQETVDFFIRNLLAGKRIKNLSDTSFFATPYDLLKDYIKGKTDFQRSQLKQIKLNYVTLKGVNLNYSNLVGAELKQANLSNSSLKMVNLNQANLEKAILKEVNFESASLNQANITDAHLEGANFTAANLQSADLRDGYFVNACFVGADLRNAKFQGANLKGASYSSQTNFNQDFDPSNWGMKLVEEDF